ncbi:hypothetical protein ACAS46_000910 [Vibrio vulnificus]
MISKSDKFSFSKSNYKGVYNSLPYRVVTDTYTKKEHKVYCFVIEDLEGLENITLNHLLQIPYIDSYYVELFLRCYMQTGVSGVETSFVKHLEKFLHSLDGEVINTIFKRPPTTQREFFTLLRYPMKDTLTILANIDDQCEWNNINIH